MGRDALLPLRRLQLQGGGVLRYSPPGRILRAAIELGRDFQRDRDLAVGVGDEVGDDFVGELHQAHFGRRGGHLGRAIEHPRLGRGGRERGDW